MGIKPELPEKDFIRDEKNLNPSPMWFWIVLIFLIASLIWGGTFWIIRSRENLYHKNPFLQVTNREFSLFLWQNPEFMRVNVSSKAAYLPGFQYMEKVTIEPGQADIFVEAPLSVVFAYHAWNRLVGREISIRSIDPQEFLKFLNDVEEWKPDHWKDAPQKYHEIVKNISSQMNESLEDLPFQVKLAFQGWKNFFKEGELINSTKPTYGEVEEFLKIYPHYARNFWKNLEDKPNYLKSFGNENFKRDALIPEDEMSGLLKLAFFNHKFS